MLTPQQLQLPTVTALRNAFGQTLLIEGPLRPPDGKLGLYSRSKGLTLRARHDTKGSVSLLWTPEAEHSTTFIANVVQLRAAYPPAIVEPYLNYLRHHPGRIKENQQISLDANAVLQHLPTLVQYCLAFASPDAFVLTALPDIPAEVSKAIAKAVGQGFGVTPEERRAIELHAMAAAQHYFEDEGWDCKDTSANKPYDFECTKDGATLWVEVKGTKSAGEAVILTRNEVKHNKRHAPQTALFILAGIRTSKGAGGISISGGSRRCFWPWQLDDQDCQPLAYMYTCPPLSEIGHE
jgi:hypothetical protein